MAVVGWLLVGAAFLVFIAAVNGSWVTIWEKFTTAESGKSGGASVPSSPVTVAPASSGTASGGGSGGFA